jgi:hypothetical protein
VWRTKRQRWTMGRGYAAAAAGPRRLSGGASRPEEWGTAEAISHGEGNGSLEEEGRAHVVQWWLVVLLERAQALDVLGE